MRRHARVIRAVGMLAVLFACASGCDRNVKRAEVASPAEPSSQPDPSGDSPVPVRLVAVKQTEWKRTTRQPATVHAYFQSAIRPRVSGYVVEVVADIGDVVEAGQTLARIDVPELTKQRETLTARIDLLVAEEDAAMAGIQLAGASVQSAKAKLEQVRSERAEVDASLAAAESEFDRTEDLVDRGSLQDRMLDEARMRRDSQRAAKAAVGSAVAAAQADIGVAEAERDAARARLRTAQAKTRVARGKRDELDVMLSFADVRAPFTGLITDRFVELGELIAMTQGQIGTPLFTLSQTDRVRVRVPVPEADATFVQPGDTMELTFPSFPDEPAMQTKVTRTSGDLDISTRTMMIEADFNNEDGRLLPGMFGEAVIELSTRADVTVLPSRAVRFGESGQAFVYLVDDEDMVQVADVVTGADTGEAIEILSGVGPNARVIDAHLQRFTDGQTVRPL